MRKVGQHEAQQEVLQRRAFRLVSKRPLDHQPERRCQVVLFNLPPHRRRVVEVDLDPPLDPRMEDRSHQLKQLRLVGLGDHRNHLAVQVGGSVVAHNKPLDLLEPLLGVEELSTLRQMGPQVWIYQPQLLQQDARLVRSEASTVQSDVEQPVGIEVGLFLGVVQQKLGGGLVSLDTDFDFKCPDLVQPDLGHAIEHDERKRVLELLVGIVPKDDASPLTFFVEEAI